jgi:hypothetical protein
MAKTEKIAYILEQVGRHGRAGQDRHRHLRCAKIEAWPMIRVQWQQISTLGWLACNSFATHTSNEAATRSMALRSMHYRLQSVPGCCFLVGICSSSRVLLCCCFILRAVCCACVQVRLCLAKKDYIRAQILARKISARAFQKQQGDSTGEIGIEGTAIEEADAVSAFTAGQGLQVQCAAQPLRMHDSRTCCCQFLWHPAIACSYWNYSNCRFSLMQSGCTPSSSASSCLGMAPWPSLAVVAWARHMHVHAYAHHCGHIVLVLSFLRSLRTALSVRLAQCVLLL